MKRNARHSDFAAAAADTPKRRNYVHKHTIYRNQMAKAVHHNFHITLSPNGDLKALPSKVLTWLRSTAVKRAYCVTERGGKWHIHMVVTLEDGKRTDNVTRSVRTLCPEEWEKPAVHTEALITCSPEGIAGGYLGKTETVKTLYNRGFSDADLEAGRREHEEGKQRARLTTYARTLTKLDDHKYQHMKIVAAEDIYMTEGYHPSSADVDMALIRAGFCFDMTFATGKESLRESIKKSYHMKMHNAGLEGAPAVYSRDEYYVAEHAPDAYNEASADDAAATPLPDLETPPVVGGAGVQSTHTSAEYDGIPWNEDEGITTEEVYMREMYARYLEENAYVHNNTTEEYEIEATPVPQDEGVYYKIPTSEARSEYHLPLSLTWDE